MRRLLAIGVFVGGLAAIASLGAQTPGSSAVARPADRADAESMKGRREPAAAFGTIQGRALDSAGRPLVENAVRLRDARAGRVAEPLLTGRYGEFAFRPVEPGTYVAELIGPNRRVVATSELVSVEAGDTRSVTIRMASITAPFGGLLGGTVGEAGAIITAATAAGVLTVAVTNNAITPQ